ncbi:MAG TPA: FAD-binding protein [Gemmatimonadaceae bacterium]
MARVSRRPRMTSMTSMTSVAIAANPIKETVDDAIASSTPLRTSGRSHWIDAGRPVNATRIASLTAHSGIVDYVPGDLTITVRSGTTLKEIEEVTRAEGQWLPLDPFGSRDGTIGATIATGSFGPLATGFGRARDLVLGIEFVTGEGKIVRGGGRVVKNVAGFDLVRLVTGSWGTLGIITEATLRLYSAPATTITLALGVSDNATALQQRINNVLEAPGIPFSVELVDSRLSAKLGIAEKQQLLIRLGGNAAAVNAQRSAMESLGGARIIDARVWDTLRTFEDEIGDNPPIVIRVSGVPQRVGQIWCDLQKAIEAQGYMHATPSLGIVRCVLPASAPREVISRVASISATVIFERLPREMWSEFSPTVTGDRISQRVKHAFDPLDILNPGILGPKL